MKSATPSVKLLIFSFDLISGFDLGDISDACCIYTWGSSVFRVGGLLLLPSGTQCPFLPWIVFSQGFITGFPLTPSYIHILLIALPETLLKANSSPVILLGKPKPKSVT